MDPVNSIFEKDWWLEALVPGRWKAAEVRVDGKCLARLPFVASQGRLLSKIGMPPLTPGLGPWLAPLEGKYANQLGRQKDLLTQLIDALPPSDILDLDLHPSLTNWLPFYWRGFTQTTRYTYILDLSLGEEALWAGTLDNVRTDVRKAQKTLQVKTGMEVSRFLEIVGMTFGRQGKQIPYTVEQLRRLDEACAARASRQVFYAEDAQGKVHAAIYLIWDEHSAYYLMGGADPALRNSGAMSLLIWEAIRFASGKVRHFDFEGSMMEGVERFFRAFGARQTPYFTIRRLSQRAKVLLAARDGMRVGAQLVRRKS